MLIPTYVGIFCIDSVKEVYLNPRVRKIGKSLLCVKSFTWSSQSLSETYIETLASRCLIRRRAVNLRSLNISRPNFVLNHTCATVNLRVNAEL